MTDFLQLNRWAVSVEDKSAQRSWEEIGSRGASLGGTARDQVVARKRVWEGRSTILSPEDAAALLGLLHRRGDRWSFNSGTTSSKGRIATSAGTVAAVAQTIAESVAVERTIPKLGAGCAAIYGSASNILSANQSNVETNTTGFAAVDTAALTRDNAQHWQGGWSLKVVTSGAANSVQGGVQVDVACAGATAYTASVYLRAASGTPTVEVLWQDDKGTTSTIRNVQLSATAWKRVEVSGTTHGSAATLSLLVLEGIADAGITFWADGLQVEATSFATPWVAGNDPASTAGSLYCTLGELQADDDLTIMCWTRGAPSGTDGYIIWVGDTATDCVYLKSTAAGALLLSLLHDGSAGGMSASKASAWDGAWHHVAGVIRRDPRTGSHSAMLYYDGAEAAAADATIGATPPDLIAPTMYVGTDYTGALPLNGFVDELVVLPWAATAAQIAAWYAYEFSDLPYLSASGRFIGPVSVNALPELAGYTLVQAAPDGTWAQDAAQLGIRLREK